MEEKQTNESEVIETWELKAYYEKIKLIISKYMDMNDEDKEIVVMWLLSSFFQKSFNSFPYLFLNAQKSSGKTRLLKLLSYLTNGIYTVNITEAVLFRKQEPIFIDEIEDITRKEKVGLRELLNVAYKKGGVVERAEKNERGEIKVKTFPVYRVVGMANIYGMEDVLEGRCITIILERSLNPIITRIPELFDLDPDIQEFKKMVDGLKAYTEEIQNFYTIFFSFLEAIIAKYIQGKKDYTIEELLQLIAGGIDTEEKQDVSQFLVKIWNSQILARDLEIFLPLLIVAWKTFDVEKENFDNFLEIIKKKVKEREVEDVSRSRDVAFLSFLANKFVKEKDSDYIKEIAKEFKDYENEEWITPVWVAHALSRLKVVREKKRTSVGVKVWLDVDKIVMKAKQYGIYEEESKEEGGLIEWTSKEDSTK
jgi:hypothetical protein